MTFPQSRAHHLERATESQAARLENRTAFRRFARAGLGARAAIYGVLAILCIDLAMHGSAPAPADGEGAIDELAHQPAGPFLLVLLAIGLSGYASWRVTHAVAPMTAGSKMTTLRRVGLASSGALYLFLCAQAIELLARGGSGGSSSGNPQPIAAAMLRWPIGAALLGLAAVCVIGSGLAFAIWGAMHDYGAIFDGATMPSRVFGAAHAFGIAGDVTRGLVIALAGVYLMIAAMQDKASKVKGIDATLESLTHDSGAVGLLALVAAGMFAFALYSVLEAAYRRV